MTAASTAVLARVFSGEQFGLLASAMAVFYLALAASDFGFGFVLARDLAVSPDKGALLRTGIRVQLAWSAVLAICMAILGLSGIAASADAAPVIAILAIGVMTAGLSGGRQVFLVEYRTGLLTIVDLTTTALTVAATIAVAVAGGGPIGVAIAATAGTALNSAIILGLALRIVGPAHARVSHASRDFIRRAVPFGLVSFMTSIYFTIDLALLGWLVVGQELGDYAAATKVLSLLVVLPSLLMNAALPGLSGAVGDRVRLTALASRLAHWMAATGFPVCVGTAIFAPELITAVFGEKYSGAVGLTRILATVAALALVSNIVGNILGAARVVRPMLVWNAIAIVFNVGGNLLLVPRYGVAAAAWLTLATEVFVLGCALCFVPTYVDLGALIRSAMRPVLATIGAGALALVLSPYPAIAFVAGAVAFGVAIVLLRAWPVELVPKRRNRGVESEPCRERLREG
jgi:O-antigen/teichoic acid export membrane protein